MAEVKAVRRRYPSVGVYADLDTMLDLSTPVDRLRCYEEHYGGPWGWFVERKLLPHVARRSEAKRRRSMARGPLNVSQEQAQFLKLQRKLSRDEWGAPKSEKG